MIELLPFKNSSVTADEWDSFVDSADNGTIFHKRRFLSYHPSDRFEDASFIVKKDNKIMSVFPAVLVNREGKRVLSSHSGASYGGFVYKQNLNLREAFDLVENLLSYAGQLKCDRVQLTPPPMIYKTKYSDYIDFALVKNGFNYLKEMYPALFNWMFLKTNFFQHTEPKRELPLRKL